METMALDIFTANEEKANPYTDLCTLNAAGDNLLLRVFNFYYIPRAAIIIVVYLIGVTLSKRTHGLLKQQEEDNRDRCGTSRGHPDPVVHAALYFSGLSGV